MSQRRHYDINHTFSNYLPNLDEVNPVPPLSSGTYLHCQGEAFASLLDAASGNAAVNFEERRVHLLLDEDASKTTPQSEVSMISIAPFLAF
jgi:hypothetical protein